MYDVKTKESFILMYDWWHLMEDLTMEQRGQLLTAMYDAELGRSLDLESYDDTLRPVLRYIINQLDQNKKKYAEVLEKRSLAGKKSARMKKEKAEKESTKSTRVKSVATNSTSVESVQHTVSVSDSVSDSVSVSDNNKKLKCRVAPDGISDVVSYLNKVTGAHYRPETGKTRRLIKARLNEGLTVDDLKAVIDVKSEQWLGDEKMSRFLRPETLFGTKCEGYLQEAKHETEKHRGDRREEIERQLDYIEGVRGGYIQYDGVTNLDAEEARLKQELEAMKA